MSRAMTLYGILEDRPGPRWQALFQAMWPSYRSWYLSEGRDARPSLPTAAAMLKHYMPELVPTWERLVALTGDDPLAATMLTLWNPPKFLPGCSQVALTGPRPALIRNYDYTPDLFEQVSYSSQFGSRRVLGTGDCLWGLLDGMNNDGLAISLAYGGREGSSPGFAAPLLVRYLLETCGSTAEAQDRLGRLPASMSYNLTIVDRRGNAVTAFVAPGEDPAYFEPAATNHRGETPERPEHARRFRSVERRTVLTDALNSEASVADMASLFLQSPLYSRDYDHAFGTLYTALYRPADGEVDYIWPDGTRWTRSFNSEEETKTVILGGNAESSPLQPGGHPAPAPPDWEPSEQATVAELGDLTRHIITDLAHRPDQAAFAELLSLYEALGIAMGESARTLAQQGSWSNVADVAGVSKQAAWYRWRG